MEVVLEQVERVAPTDATVLVQGETGTGKELIARAVHDISSRFGRRFVKLNCAAIPFDLLESELFGHEKEDLPALLRKRLAALSWPTRGPSSSTRSATFHRPCSPNYSAFCRNKNLERLGSTRTHQVDVRLVAATNRNLADMVKRGEFRSDLYYRLNVFPIPLPALRERREDIPALIEHFVRFMPAGWASKSNAFPQRQ